MLTPAHLLGESWHIADVLLYGGATVGFALGIGLFLWGRHERRSARDGERTGER